MPLRRTGGGERKGVRPLDRAVLALRAGQVVLYPTDTLYGLAVLASDRRALPRLFRVKRRPQGSPVSIAFSSLEEIEPWAELAPASRRTLRALLPGPFTLLLTPSARARATFPAPLFGPHGTIAVRLPDQPVARELARRAGPITSTSANLHGRSPVRDLREARRLFRHDVAVVLGGGPAPSGRPSTLLDARRGPPRAVARR